MDLWRIPNTPLSLVFPKAGLSVPCLTHCLLWCSFPLLCHPSAFLAVHLPASAIPQTPRIIPFSWFLNAVTISSPPSTASSCPSVKWTKLQCQEPSWVRRAGLRLNGENPWSYRSSWFPNIFYHSPGF